MSIGAVLGAVAVLMLTSTATAAASAPQVTEQVPLWVDQTSATLQAKINPNGLATTYHFEYGETPGLGKRVPADHDLFIGAGAKPVVGKAFLNGLQPESIYYYRIVATNADGTSIGQTRQFSTLNTEGLAWGRRFELVSLSLPPTARFTGQLQG